jgi:hypothetical protein
VTASKTKREPLSIRIKDYIMRYIRVKASVLGVRTNILIEDALKQLLEKIETIERMKAFSLIFNPVKAKRIRITVMINENIAKQAHELAKELDVFFAEVVEAAIILTIREDLKDMKSGKLSKFWSKPYLRSR